MSENRLRKHLDKTPVFVESQNQWKPICFSDSKGNYLDNANPHEEIAWEITWKTFRGGDSTRICQALRGDIQNLTQRYGKVHIYLWAGTCDLTSKNGPVINIHPSPQEAQRQLVNNLLSLEEHVTPIENVRLTVLQIPYYSVRVWNDIHGVSQPHDKEKDDQIKSLIDVVNGVIDQINERAGNRSPKFNVDIEKTYKHKNQCTKYATNWSLFRDGIHPGDLLAKVWLRNICKEIKRRCY